MWGFAGGRPPGYGFIVPLLSAAVHRAAVCAPPTGGWGPAGQKAAKPFANRRICRRFLQAKGFIGFFGSMQSPQTQYLCFPASGGTFYYPSFPRRSACRGFSMLWLTPHRRRIRPCRSSAYTSCRCRRGRGHSWGFFPCPSPSWRRGCCRPRRRSRSPWPPAPA